MSCDIYFHIIETDSKKKTQVEKNRGPVSSHISVKKQDFSKKKEIRSALPTINRSGVSLVGGVHPHRPSWMNLGGKRQSQVGSWGLPEHPHRSLNKLTPS